MFVAFVVIMAIVLVQLWIQFFIYVAEDNVWGHKNYLHLDIGAYLLLGILLVATPTLVYVAWKERPRQWRARGRKGSQ